MKAILFCLCLFIFISCKKEEVDTSELDFMYNASLNDTIHIKSKKITYYYVTTGINKLISATNVNIDSVAVKHEDLFEIGSIDSTNLETNPEVLAELGDKYRDLILSNLLIKDKVLLDKNNIPQKLRGGFFGVGSALYGGDLYTFSSKELAIKHRDSLVLINEQNGTKELF